MHGPNPATAPVGVFDSGVGGLSVLAEIRRHLPAEALVYVADSGFGPYGNRTPGYIAARSAAIAEFLVREGAKAIVVACNTATAAIAPVLRQHFLLPVIAIEPAVKPAAAASRSRVIGVLATQQTLESERFARLVADHAAGADVLAEPCQDLVEFVEQGLLTEPAVEHAVTRHVATLRRAGADVIVLGCTHFHFLRPLVAAAAGPGATVVDPGAAVARELGRRLDTAGLRSTATRAMPVRIYTSSPAAASAALIERLCPAPLLVSALPAEFCAAPPD
jgi:glutamate racemase